MSNKNLNVEHTDGSKLDLPADLDPPDWSPSAGAPLSLTNNEWFRGYGHPIERVDEEATQRAADQGMDVLLLDAEPRSIDITPKSGVRYQIHVDKRTHRPVSQGETESGLTINLEPKE